MLQTVATKTRRDFLKTAAASAVLLGAIRVSAQEKRPNFVIVIGDDVGWGESGAYGNPLIRTPNIDAMAKQGIQFNSAFLTISSCSPSRASIMTGLYPHNTGAGELHEPLANEAITMPKLLKRAGYYTVCAGKFHMGNIQDHFDLVTDSQPSGCEEWVKVLQNRPKEKPFFCWFAGHDAHRGWSATKGPAAIPNPHADNEVAVPPYLPDTPAARRDLAQYYDEVSRLDSYLGKVLAELDSQGVLENTFVLFMSDNGKPFPRCKTTLYDSGLKTPFVVRWHGKVAPGIQCASLVSSVDIAPTIIELAGLERPKGFEGVSFTPLLKDPAAKIRDYIHGEHNWHDYQAHERSVRSDRFLYINNAFPWLPGTPPADAVSSTTFQEMRKLYAQGKLAPEQASPLIPNRAPEELYDIEKDPYSFHNVAGDPEYAGVLDRMRGEYRNWAEKTGDKVPESPTPDGFDRETAKKLIRGMHPAPEDNLKPVLGPSPK